MIGEAMSILFWILYATCILGIAFAFFWVRRSNKKLRDQSSHQPPKRMPRE